MMKGLEEVCKLVKAVVWAVLVQWKDKAWRFKRYRDYGGQMA